MCVFCCQGRKPTLDDLPLGPNIEPENDGLEDNFPFQGVYSQVPC